MKFIDVLDARATYQKGDNVTEFLRAKYGSSHNTSEIIEIAYDLQAGSYVDIVNSNLDKSEKYTNEISEILSKHLETGDSLLDIGTGEMTTLTFVLNKISTELSDILALDISWSRLSIGMQFHLANRISVFPLKPFVADIKEIPLHEKCVDVIISSHALEPNGSNLEVLLRELFRVTKRKLILFEPSYELNSEQGKARMDAMGYVKNIEESVLKLGGKLVEVIPNKNIGNPLNPTACYIIEPPSQDTKFLEAATFCVPGTNLRLESQGMYLFSNDTGLVFPILDEIAILKNKSAILATSKCSNVNP